MPHRLDRRAPAATGVVDAGATIVNARFVHRSAEHLLEQLAALPALFPDAHWEKHV